MRGQMLAFRHRLVLACVGMAGLLVMTGGETKARANGDSDDQFYLGGTAQLAQDPENPANDVIRIRTDVAPFFGTVSRRVNVKVEKLDNMLEFKAWFQTPKTCIGGSPRFQLAIDTDGDGTSNGNAFGYFGASPSFAGCPMQTWLYEDLTGPGDIFITGGVLAPSTGQGQPNEELEWDLTQFGGAFYNTWSAVETFFNTAHPNHQVCTVALVDDTFGAPGMTGTAYYDVISAGRATWVDRSNGTRRGFARGCGRDDGDRDDDDDDSDGKNDDEDSDDDGDGQNDDADSDDDNDGINDAWDSNFTREEQLSNSAQLASGDEASYVMDANLKTVSFIAVADNGQAVTLEILDPLGLVIARSLPVIGRVTITAPSIGPGNYTLKVKNSGLTPAASSVTFVRSDRWF